MASNGAGFMRNNSNASGGVPSLKSEPMSAHSPINQWPLGAAADTNSTDLPGVSQSGNHSQSASATASQSQSTQHAVDKRRLHDLISEVDPYQQVDEDAESCLLDIADDFIDTVLAAACQVAKHRKSPILEAKDVQYVLDTQYNLWMPGFGVSDTKQAYKRPAPTDAHKQRLAIIKKLFKTH